MKLQEDINQPYTKNHYVKMYIAIDKINGQDTHPSKKSIHSELLTLMSWSKVDPSPLARQVEKTAAFRSAARDEPPEQ